MTYLLQSSTTGFKCPNTPRSDTGELTTVLAQMALLKKKFSLCHSLASQGADWDHRDNHGSSTADEAWWLIVTRREATRRIRVFKWHCK